MDMLFANNFSVIWDSNISAIRMSRRFCLCFCLLFRFFLYFPSALCHWRPQLLYKERPLWSSQINLKLNFKFNFWLIKLYLIPPKYGVEDSTKRLTAKHREWKERRKWSSRRRRKLRLNQKQTKPLETNNNSIAHEKCEN